MIEQGGDPSNAQGRFRSDTEKGIPAMKNLERYKDDLNQLITTGEDLHFAMQLKCHPEQFKKIAKEELGNKAQAMFKNLPSFSEGYQAWYSEAKALVRQLLPDRLDDFSGYYEKAKLRKAITAENYRISDYLAALQVTRREGMVQKVIVGPSAAIPSFVQQLTIVKAIRKRFESSLFDIRTIMQADLFDSELEAAKALVQYGFFRAGGALAGVVMERHLAQVCENHAIKFRKKKLTIADFNDALKEADAIDLPQWRFNQHLGDLRNLCDHDKATEPTSEQATDLVDGVMKLTKTLF